MTTQKREKWALVPVNETSGLSKRSLSTIILIYIWSSVLSFIFLEHEVDNCFFVSYKGLKH